jgi:hypothetical protein
MVRSIKPKDLGVFALVGAMYFACCVLLSEVASNPTNGSMSQSNLTSSINSYPSPPAIAVGVMGPKDAFLLWKLRLRNLTLPFIIDLFYLAYDEEVDPLNCDGWLNRAVDCTYLESSWTQGRNELGRRIWIAEHRHELQYKYWVMLDEDIHLTCGSTKTVDQCFQLFFELLLKPEVQFASVTGLNRGRSRTDDSVYFTDQTDAMLAAFHHKSLPVVLPYIERLDNVSWWGSQELLYHVNRQCLHRAGVVLSDIAVQNTVHRDYARGKVADENISSALSTGIPSIKWNHTSWIWPDHGEKRGAKWLNFLNASATSGDWISSDNFQACLSRMHTRFYTYVS